MANKGEFTIEFKDDGSLKVESGDMGGTAHKLADDFVKELQRLMGGEVIETKLEKGHVHSHGEAGHHHHHHGGSGHHHH